MNRVFEPRKYIKVPDGTFVSPFLTATDVNQTDVPWGLLGEMSIAAGRIDGGVASAIHVHPIVTQVTYLVSGALTIRMKDPDGDAPYPLPLEAGQATVCEPGTLFQLHNLGAAPADVLYIVSPSYLFEMNEGDDAPVYDDAKVVAQTWEELAAVAYDVPVLRIPASQHATERAASLRRVAARKGG